ncbi:hypothetical protein [Ramlibacter sp.]|uniref:hypothetical protein n=1 Tax=Ramlibacter sp. TaxID=1917967 RepID=UPI0035B43492
MPAARTLATTLATPSRRHVLARLAAATGAALGGSLLAGCQTAEPVPASNLPPGKQSIALVNPGFAVDASGRFTGWTKLEHNVGNSYRFEADAEVYALSAPTSLRISRHGLEFYGLTEQRVRVQPEWIGRTVRLSGYLRTRGVTGTGAALVLQVRDGSDQILVAEQMNGRRVRGDLDWQQYSVQVRVVQAAWWLQVGAMLEDDGTLWVDDLALDLMD